LKVAEEITVLDRPDSAVAAVAMVKVAKEPVKEEVTAEGVAATEAAVAAPAGSTAAPAEKGKAAPAEKGKAAPAEKGK
jgi:hypothetical protein